MDMICNVYPCDNISHEIVTDNFPSDGMTETQHRIAFDKIEYNFSPKKPYDPRGPSFCFKHMLETYCPEKYHLRAKFGIYLDNDTVRIYGERPFRYFYHTNQVDNTTHLKNITSTYGYCKILHPEGITGNNNFCIIPYPDGTHVEIKSPEMVFRHIHHHQKNVFINQESPTDYIEYYRKHFYALKIRKRLPNTREKITINELLNREKITVNELLNSEE
jgi:hypothetical protein